MFLALGMDGFHVTFAQSAGDTRHPGRPGKLEKSPELKAGEPLSYHSMPLNLFESIKVVIFHIYVGLRKVCTRVFPCLLRFLPQFNSGEFFWVVEPPTRSIAVVQTMNHAGLYIYIYIYI